LITLLEHLDMIGILKIAMVHLLPFSL